MELQVRYPPVLVVDDCADDAVILRWLLQKAGVKNPVVVRDNGIAAQKYLMEAAAHPDSGMMPCLVLTDLNMPSMSGIELIGWIRKQDALLGLRVVMLSFSYRAADIQAATAAGADQYFMKYPPAHEFVKMIEASNAAAWRLCPSAVPSMH